jgi:hypothetical protein
MSQLGADQQGRDQLVTIGSLFKFKQMGSVKLGNEAGTGLLLEGSPIEVKEVKPNRSKSSKAQ